MADTENWRPIPGYEGYYDVSDQGFVRSLDRGRRKGRVLVRRMTGKNGRYWTVRLTVNGVPVDRLIHRLVLEAFVGPAPEGQECRHLDGDCANAKLSNLQWGTRSENNLDKIEHGTHINARKTHCPQGHPYEGDNLIKNANGSRACKKCTRRFQKEYMPEWQRQYYLNVLKPLRAARKAAKQGQVGA